MNYFSQIGIFVYIDYAIACMPWEAYTVPTNLIIAHENHVICFY